jgi:hypothetical protein
MNDEELARIAGLGATDGGPDARLLDPEVRSGSSFTFNPQAPGAVSWPRFQVVWFFTVQPADRANFALMVEALEGAAAPQAAGVNYRGTYSVSVSSAAPDFEYRMVWGLDTLAHLQGLNDLLHNAPIGLRACLKLISPVPAMRTEIMGRTVKSAMLQVDATANPP